MEPCAHSTYGKGADSPDSSTGFDSRFRNKWRGIICLLLRTQSYAPMLDALPAGMTGAPREPE